MDQMMNLPADVSDEFRAAFAVWFSEAVAIRAKHYAENFPKSTPATLVVVPGGKKFVRVATMSDSTGGMSAHAFVDVATGDVLKPDGWKRPAKGARGNIYTGPVGVTAYGGAYLRGGIY